NSNVEQNVPRVPRSPCCTSSSARASRRSSSSSAGVRAIFACAPLFCREFADAYAVAGARCYKRHRGSVMATRTRHSTSKTTHDVFDADALDARGELWPGERIGPPLRRTGGKAMLRGVIILIALGGC